MSGFEVKTTEAKGRGIYATKFYKEDDIIFEEMPIASCQLSWNQVYKYLACDNCMKPLETAEENVKRLSGDFTISLPLDQFCPTTPIRHEFISCPDCGINYCSDSCRTEALNKYHTVLCLGKFANKDHPINNLNEAWKQLHYPPETNSIMLICRILAMIKQTNAREELLAKLNDFQSISMNQDCFHKFLGDNFRNDLELLFGLTCAAFNGEEYATVLTPDGFKSLIALIATNSQGIGTSPFSVWESKASKSIDETTEEFNVLDNFINDLYKKMDEVSGVFLNNEGVGLYSLQSKINHSCSPNSEIVFPYSNYILAARAISDIKPGEEICISYLDECSLQRSRHSRQKDLRDNYLFFCQCILCEQQTIDPDVTSEEDDDDNDNFDDMQE